MEVLGIFVKKKGFRILGVLLGFLLSFSIVGDFTVKAVDINNADLEFIKINGNDIGSLDPNIPTYVYNLIIDTAIQTLTVDTKTKNENATFTIEGRDVINNNFAIVKITVTAEDRFTKKTYFIIVRINGTDDGTTSNDANLLSITVNGQPINTKNSYTDNYSLKLPVNTAGDYLSVETEVSDKKSTVYVDGTRIVNNSALVKITVIAENKLTTRVYYVNVELKEGAVSSSFINVKTADFHTLALKNDGTLYAFGENNYGQLGDNSKTFRKSPIQVKNLSNVIDFDTSNSHSIAATGDGSVWLWGMNDLGQLGTGNNKNTLVPTLVEGLYDVVKVRAGNRTSIALDRYGHVWSWGYNTKGVDDEAVDTEAFKPTLVTGLLKVKIVDIAAGDSHALALTSDGKIYAWGANDLGQLGVGDYYNRYQPTIIQNPVGIKSSVKQIGANGNTSTCIDKDGNVYYWGKVIGLSEEGILQSAPEETPQRINGIAKARFVEANDKYIIYIDQSGNAYSMGINKYGRLGVWSTTNETTFRQISEHENDIGKINNISISEHSSFFIDEEGYIYAAGRNGIGQLGTNDTTEYHAPKKLLSFGGSEVSGVYSNYRSGEVDRGASIRLNSDTLSGKIYYTLDGSNPTENSNLYKVPIIVNGYTLIKAAAFKDGKYGPVSTFEYMVGNRWGNEMNITIGNGKGKAGETVDIPISFSNIPIAGITNLKFAVKFNPGALSFDGVTYGELISDSSDFSCSRISEDTLLLSFYDNSRTSRNINKSGTFATLRFYIKYNTVTGRYPLTQVYNQEEGVYSSGSKIVNAYYNAGYIDATDSKSIIYGDVDGDSKVTALDLQYIQRYVAGKITSFPYSYGTDAADIDEDGKIDSNDVELIKKIIAKEG